MIFDTGGEKGDEGEKGGGGKMRWQRRSRIKEGRKEFLAVEGSCVIGRGGGKGV